MGVTFVVTHPTSVGEVNEVFLIRGDGYLLFNEAFWAGQRSASTDVPCKEKTVRATPESGGRAKADNIVERVLGRYRCKGSSYDANNSGLWWGRCVRYYRTGSRWDGSCDMTILPWRLVGWAELGGVELA